jgi:hypothetical protein
MKSKTTAEFIEKRTSIAAVRDKLGEIDTFSTPLLSLCGLPLNNASRDELSGYIDPHVLS